MTMREYVTTALNAHLSEDMDAKSQELLDGLDRRNEKRTSKPSKTAIANAPIKEAIVNYLREAPAPVTAATVGSACEISTNKASSLLTQIVNEGLANKADAKVKGKGTVKVYTIA